MNPVKEGPHPILLAPWFCTFSLQHSEKYIMDIYKTPRLWYFVVADLTVWGTGHFSLKALYTFIFRGESVYPLPQSSFEGTRSFCFLCQTCRPFLTRLWANLPSAPRPLALLPNLWAPRGLLCCCRLAASQTVSLLTTSGRQRHAVFKVLGGAPRSSGVLPSCGANSSNGDGGRREVSR